MLPNLARLRGKNKTIRAAENWNRDSARTGPVKETKIPRPHTNAAPTTTTKIKEEAWTTRDEALMTRRQEKE